MTNKYTVQDDKLTNSLWAYEHLPEFLFMIKTLIQGETKQNVNASSQGR